MNILLITYYFGDTASGIISQRIAEELKTQGHFVYVIAGDSTQDFDGLIKCPNFLSDSGVIVRALRKVYHLIFRDTLEYQFVWRKKAYRRACDIINKTQIDWIYCRTSPIDSFVVGDRLKRKFHIKELLHFTDPVPSEFSTYNKRILKRLVLKYKPIIEKAEMLSFGTKEMQKYEERLFGKDWSCKAFVSPDVAGSSSLEVLPLARNKGLIKLVYLGSIAGYRNPLPLYRAIDSLREEGINIQLFVYSVRPVSIDYNSDGISYCGRIADINKAMEEADILIDLDVKMADSPFISSKLKDYIRVNRPIIAITQKGTPTYNVTQGLKTIIQTSNSEEEIRTSIISASEISCSPDLYKERKTIIDYFSPKLVVNTLIERMIKYDNNK